MKNYTIHRGDANKTPVNTKYVFAVEAIFKHYNHHKHNFDTLTMGKPIIVDDS